MIKLSGQISTHLITLPLVFALMICDIENRLDSNCMLILILEFSGIVEPFCLFYT